MRLHTFVIAILSCLLAPAFSIADETKEPPLKLTLLVNGKPISIELGREQKLVGEFKNPTIVVRAAATRMFTYGGISFEYPSNFHWEAEIEGKDRNWALSGNDSIIMYFASRSEFTAETYARNMAKIFGLKNTTITPISRKLGKTLLKGKRVITILAETEIIQDAFTIPAPDKQWRLLVLQDVAPERTPKLKVNRQRLWVI